MKIHWSFFKLFGGVFLLFGPAGTVFRKIVGSILAREIVACVARFGCFSSFWLLWPFPENFGDDFRLGVLGRPHTPGRGC